jgi:bacteriocin biosynthesis cyclodehydratase domain-containing protein
MRPRLKDSVELFPTSDGDLYLLSATAGADFLISAPSEAERRVLGSLADGCDWDELASRAAQESPGFDDEDLQRTLRPLFELDLIEDAAEVPHDRLAPEEVRRYDRQLAYFSDLLPYGSSRSDRQVRLKDARIVVIGLGGLGSWAVWALACAGVGTIVGVDGDVVEPSNLNRQILYADGDIGRPKAEVAARTVLRFNPHVDFVPVPERLEGEREVADVIRGADFVIESADWPVHLIGRWVNAACGRARTPHVSASQFPPMVRIGPTVVPGRSACLECQEAAARESHPLFDELVAFRRRRPSRAPTFGPACGLIGSMLATEAVHHVTGLARPATEGRALMLDLRTLETTWHPIDPHPACGCCVNTEIDHIQSA